MASTSILAIKCSGCF